MNRQKREKVLILPRLHDHNGDLSKQWFVFYSYRNPGSGKMERFRLYDGFTEKKSNRAKRNHAKRVIEELTKKLLNGWSPFEDRSKVIYSDDLVYHQIARKYGRIRSGNKTFPYYINQFIETKADVRPASLTTYKSKFRYFLEFIKKKHWEENDIALFGEEQALEFNLYLRNERGLSNKTINEYNVLLKSFFKFLIRKSVVVNNPFIEIKRLKNENLKPRIYDPELLKKITAASRHSDLQLMVAIKIIFNCFIRPGELRGIQIKHIDIRRGKITIPAPVSKVGIQRVVDVPDYLLEDVAAHIGKRPDHHYFIFSDRTKGLMRVSRNFLYTRFVALKKAIDLPKDYILYAFKHTGMVELKRAGADWLVIKNQAGHKSLDQTIEYTTALMGDCSSVIKKIAPRI